MPFCSQGVINSARRSAKAEVRGAIPRESANLPLCLSSHRSGFVNRHSSVQVQPGLQFKSGTWCNRSISPCEGDGPGATPGFLTNQIKMRDEVLNEMGAPTGGLSSSSEYVLTPRHKDLNAGIWTQAHSSRNAKLPQNRVMTTRSYSPLFTFSMGRRMLIILPIGGGSLIARERLGESPGGAGSNPANWSPPPTSSLVHRLL